MCGIAFVRGGDRSSNGRFVEKMLSRIEYRGLSLYEIDAAGRSALGANRLNIVDRDRGHQPCWNEDRSVCGVLNGEIYNHRFLAQLLRKRGHKFATACDSEVLVHAYEEWGPRFVNRLDGMFALVVYDRQRDSVMAARDPFGVKPLYLGQARDFLAFGSELKCFIGIPVARVSLLPPGHVFCDSHLLKYFEYPARVKLVSFEAAQRCVRQRLFESVAKRLDTDLPVAVFVSGGIDSAIILKSAAQLHPHITAISVGMKGSPDLQASKFLCSRLGVRHIYGEYERLDIGGLYDKIIYHLESFEPNLVRASIFTHLMCRLAHENGFRVALAGEGSDEQFAGYTDFAALDNPGLLEEELRAFFLDLHRTQLLRWDKIGMANTLEVRFPFMDRDLVRDCWTHPTHFKLNHSPQKVITKHVLRAAFQDFLPEQIVQRDKVPMDEGAMRNGRNGLEELIQSYIGRAGLRVSSATCREFRLRSPEESYNCAVFREYFAQATFARKRVKVRCVGGL